MENIFSDEYFMKQAIKEAVTAFEHGEIPIGAVVVHNNKIISRAYNSVETLKDPTAHSEMLAITSATNAMGAKILEDCTLYVTVEPCAMCAGALFHARPSKIVYGASEFKTGFTLFKPDITHKKTEIISGILQDECKKLMTDFFVDKR